jgi:tRNA pseudouridine38-40 synthase
VDGSDTTRYFKATLAYDGTAYAGWQVQPEQPTIQACLESALERIIGAPVRVVASGRTDAGVHALRQVVSFRTATHLAADVLQRALNANTPEDIHVWNVSEARCGFHAIRDAVAKRYRYVMLDGPHPDIFLRRYAWHIVQPLDVQRMDAAVQYLVGRHDFSSFEASGAPRKSSVRTVSEVWVRRFCEEQVDRIVLEIEADGFLYNMVRNIVGTAVVIGRGGQTPEWILEVLNARDRSQAGPTAPAHGLTLVRVDYGDDSTEIGC